MLDGAEFGKEVVDLVRGYVERELVPIKTENAALKERLIALESRPWPEKGDAGEKGEDGVSPEPEAIADAFAPLAEQIILDAVAKAVSEIPPAERGEAGEKGEPGKDADPEALEAAVEVAVAKAVEALPKPKDGLDGKDAAGIVEALKDSGELVLTLADGRLVRTGVRDGEPGRDGRDGIELDSFEAIVLDDDRTIELKFVSGETERVASFKWPVPIDCGVYRVGEQYQRGDAVTWGGSLWLAQRDTDAKPDGPDSGWRLAVKKGRDGKDARG